MSAEVEENKEEEKKEVPNKRHVSQKVREHWQIGLKVLEIAISAICIGYAYEPVENITWSKKHLDHIGVIYTTYTGYILINAILLLGRALGDRFPYRTCSIFSLVGAILYLVSGVVLISHRVRGWGDTVFHPPKSHLSPMLTTSIVFAFVNFVVFVVDGVVTFIKQKDF